MTMTDGLLRDLAKQHLTRADADVWVKTIVTSAALLPSNRASDVVIGGTPNLPGTGTWPTWHHGPLAHIATINCAKVSRSIPDFPLPDHGSLVFFAHDRKWARDNDYGDHICDAHWPNSSAGWLVRHYPDRIGVTPDLMPQTPGYQMSTHISVPESQAESPYDVLALSSDPEGVQALGTALHEAEEDANFRCNRVGGVPAETEVPTRPRAEMARRGITRLKRLPEHLRERYEPEQDSLDYEDPYAMMIPYDGNGDWLLLLQIDSDDSLGLCWGDADKMIWLIKREDAEDGAWDRSWMFVA